MANFTAIEKMNCNPEADGSSFFLCLFCYHGISLRLFQIDFYFDLLCEQEFGTGKLYAADFLIGHF